VRLEFVLFDQSAKLPDLVGLGPATLRLQVQIVGNPGVLEQVMTPPLPDELKPVCFHEPHEISEPNVVNQACGYPFKKPPVVHSSAASIIRISARRRLASEHSPEYIEGLNDR
jgi:hypothetical protein